MGEVEDIQAFLNDKDLSELQNEESGSSSSEPVMDNDKIDVAVDKLRSIQENNGFHGIAHDVELSVRQVKLIDKLRKEKIAELTPPEE